MLIRIFVDEGNKELNKIPDYKSGIFNNDFFSMYPGELLIMKQFTEKRAFSVGDVMNLLYQDLVEKDQDISKMTNNGTEKSKLLEYIDQNYFDQVPEETVTDDFDTLHIPITSGFSLSVDAVHQSKEKCRQ